MFRLSSLSESKLGAADVVLCLSKFLLLLFYETMG